MFLAQFPLMLTTGLIEEQAGSCELVEDISSTSTAVFVA